MCVRGQRNGVDRWLEILGNATAESGGNNGTDYQLVACTDAGVTTNVAISAKRSTGVVTMANGAVVQGGAGLIVNGIPAGATAMAVTGVSGAKLWVDFNGGGTNYYDATTHNFRTAAAAQIAGITTGGIMHALNGTTTDGVFRFGTGGANYLSFESGQFNLIGGPVSVNSGLEASGIGGGSLKTAGGISSALSYYCGGIIQIAGGGAYNQAGFVAALKIGFGGGGTQYGIVTRPNADNTNLLYIANASNTIIGSISQTATGVAYNVSSSAELKEDLKSFDAGSIVDRTNVYDFAWKTTGERSYGVIAQQAVDVYPAAVTHSQQDDAKDDFWGVDYSKYVPVLLQELKALRARVADLEGRLAARPA
jgi:hypothetical protein